MTTTRTAITTTYGVSESCVDLNTPKILRNISQKQFDYESNSIILKLISCSFWRLLNWEEFQWTTMCRMWTPMNEFEQSNLLTMELFVFRETERIVFTYDKWTQNYSFCGLHHNLDKILKQDYKDIHVEAFDFIYFVA